MWTETKTNDQFSSTGWIVKSSQIFCLRKDTCSKPKPRQNCIGQLDRARSVVTCHTNDVIQDVTEKYWMSHPVFVTYVSLSTNRVIHCESYNLQAGLKSPLTGAKRLQSGAKRPVSGRNVQGAKRPGGETSRDETSWGRNVQWRGEKSINRDIQQWVQTIRYRRSVMMISNG